jgi:translation initiation factor 2B subunit (eIF-2B alpha/beta/delta family)
MRCIVLKSVRGQVLIGAHALLANGGVMAPSGAHMVALAAKRHSVPFVVLAGLHKLSPLFPHDPSVTFNDFKVASPHLPQLSLVNAWIGLMVIRKQEGQSTSEM